MNILNYMTLVLTVAAWTGLSAAELGGDIGLTGLKPETLPAERHENTPLEEFGYPWEVGFPWNKRSIGIRFSEPREVSRVVLELERRNPDPAVQPLTPEEIRRKLQILVSSDNRQFEAVPGVTIRVDGDGDRRYIAVDGIDQRCRYLKVCCDRDSRWYYGAENLQTILKAYSSPLVGGEGDAVVYAPGTDGDQKLHRTLVAASEVALPDQAATDFSVNANARTIIFTIHCVAAPGGVRPEMRAKNSMDLFRDEHIELFLAPDRKKQLVYQLAVNAAGSVTELLDGNPVDGVAAARASDIPGGYELRIIIDRERLRELAGVVLDASGSEYSPDFWFFNVCREIPSLPPEHAFQSWIYTGSEQFLNRDAMGMLLLTTPEKALANLTANFQRQMEMQLENVDLAAAPGESAEIARIAAALQTLRSETALPAGDAAIAADVAAAQKNMAAKQAEAAGLLETLKLLRFALPEADQQRGFVWFRVPTLEHPSERRLPETAEFIDTLKMTLLRDEAGYGRFALYAGRELTELEFSVGELAGPDGAVIPAEEADLRVVRAWGPPEDADILATDDRIALAGWLENYAAAPRHISRVAAGTSAHFILEVRSRADQPAGVYTGAITVRNANGEFALPLAVEVLPTTLQRTERDVGFFLTGILHQPDSPPAGSRYGANGLTTEAAMRAELRALVRDGFTKMVITANAGKDGPLSPDYALQLLRIAQDAGLRKLTLSGANDIPGLYAVRDGQMTFAGEPEYRQAQAEMDRKLAAIAAGCKAEALTVEPWIFGFDEPRNPVMVRITNDIFAAAHKAGLRTEVAVVLETAGQQLSGVDNLLILYSHNMHDAELLARVRAGQSGYPRIGYYANNMGNQLRIVRLANGFHMYKNNFSGNLPWAYYDLQNDWDPFRERIPKCSASVAYYIFPTRDEPIPTLKYVASHEGLNDLRYLETLDMLLMQCADPIRAASVRAKRDALLRQFEYTNSGGNASYNFTLSERFYDHSRHQLQQMIRELVLP